MRPVAVFVPYLGGIEIAISVIDSPTYLSRLYRTLEELKFCLHHLISPPFYGLYRTLEELKYRFLDLLNEILPGLYRTLEELKCMSLISCVTRLRVCTVPWRN